MKSMTGWMLKKFDENWREANKNAGLEERHDNIKAFLSQALDEMREKTLEEAIDEAWSRKEMLSQTGGYNPEVQAGFESGMTTIIDAITRLRKEGV